GLAGCQTGHDRARRSRAVHPLPAGQRGHPAAPPAGSAALPAHPGGRGPGPAPGPVAAAPRGRRSRPRRPVHRGRPAPAHLRQPGLPHRPADQRPGAEPPSVAELPDHSGDPGLGAAAARRRPGDRPGWRGGLAARLPLAHARPAPAGVAGSQQDRGVRPSYRTGGLVALGRPRAPCHRRDRPIRRPGSRSARGAGDRRHRHCLAERPKPCPGRPGRHDARHEGPGVPGRRRHRRGAGPGPGTGRRRPGDRGPPRVRPGPAAGTLCPVRRLHQGPGSPPRLWHRRAEPVPAARRGRAGPAPSRASFAVRSTPVVRDQAFPDRPVRIIDPFGAGGGVDVIARALASRLAAAWGQPAIVENHPGAGSTAAPALVAQAPPDGYTLLINTSAQAYSAARAGELPYDPLRDFVPVAALTSQPYVLVAGAPSGITTIGELAAAASGRPGEIRFASAGTGTGTHLAVAKLNRDLGIAAVHTPPAATDAITDVIAGTAA